MINNIIFDFDGVLADSEVLVAQSLSKYLADRNIQFKENEFSKFAGKKTYEIISELSKLFKIEDEQLFLNDVFSLADNLYVNNLQAVSGVINFLKNTNHNRLIGSNNIKKRIVAGLQKIGLDNYFFNNSIFSYDLVGIPKPEPDIYLKAIEISGINKIETVIIEDSVIGIQAGVAAGIKVIGLTAGGHWYEGRSNQELYDAGAYEVVKNFEDMLLLLNKL